MKGKLLFFDIDGTLLAGGLDGMIPESAVDALEQSHKNGHLLFINTGRSYCYLPSQVKDLPFDGYICGCGTEIFLHGEEVFHYELPGHIRSGMKDILRKCGIQAVYEGRKHLYYDTSTEMIPPVAAVYRSSLKMEPDLVRSFDDPDPDYDKFCLFANDQSNISLFTSLLPPELEILRSEGKNTPWRFMEIVPRGCSKATGIDYITEYLGKTPDDCYVFGDGANDLPMLVHVKNSIAMGNSAREIFKDVSYITTPVDRDGIMIALKHFGLI